MDNMEWLTPDYDEDMWEKANLMTEKWTTYTLVTLYKMFEKDVDSVYKITANKIMQFYDTYMTLSNKQRAVIARCLAPLYGECVDVIRQSQRPKVEKKLTELKKVEIYTDGACSGNPGKGGWGVVLVYNNNIKKLSGKKEYTTNNEMELSAVKFGLEALNERCNVRVYSDSAYIVNAINQGWLDNWIKCGWVTSTNTAVKNQELWEAIVKLMKQHNVEFVKVKGHAGNRYNEMADELAVSAKFDGKYIPPKPRSNGVKKKYKGKK